MLADSTSNPTELLTTSAYNKTERHEDEATAYPDRQHRDSGHLVLYQTERRQSREGGLGRESRMLGVMSVPRGVLMVVSFRKRTPYHRSSTTKACVAALWRFSLHLLKTTLI